MDLNKATLSEFEEARIGESYIPPYQSNTFFDIGDGRINLFCKNADPPVFQLIIYNGSVRVGNNFTFGDPYEYMKILENTSLIIEYPVSICSHIVINGEMIISDNTSIAINTNIVQNQTGSLYIGKDVDISIADDCRITLFGG